MIINMNLSPYMCSPDRLPEVQAYAEVVDAAIVAGKLSGPFTTTCPECGDDFADTDAARNDDLHIIVTLTSDTLAVVVACEGYFVVNPNLVGIDSPMWSGDDALGDEVTGVHDGGCNGDHHDTDPCNR